MRYHLTLAVLGLCVACTTTTSRSRPAAAPVYVACAPGDQTWGCQSGAQQLPNPSAMNGAMNTAPQQPIPMTGQPAPAPPISPAPVPTSPPPAAPAPNTMPMPSVAANDAISRADTGFQRQRVSSILAELIAALDANTRGRVERLPLTFDPDRANVNAFASCSNTGKATIAITEGMLILTAYLAQLQASDEITGARHFDDYVARVARNQTQNTPPLVPDPNWVSVDARMQATKSARQSQLNDEMFAFVIGHELAHHYLNHLPCTSVLPLDAAEIGILLTSAVPGFNQPNEVAADMAGTRNVLQAGRRRTSGQLTEGGALLTMRFFRGLDQSSPADVFSFERSHPPPSLREPIISSAAQAFRATAGISWPF